MKDAILQTLKTHYGVTECMVYERSKCLEVMCVGGDVDYVCLALQQICDTEKVKVMRSGERNYVIGVQLV